MEEIGVQRVIDLEANGELEDLGVLEKEQKHDDQIKTLTPSDPLPQPPSPQPLLPTPPLVPSFESRPAHVIEAPNQDAPNQEQLRGYNKIHFVGV